MNNEEIIKQYVPLVYFLGKVWGENCEIVLHDFRDPDASVVAIANGHLSKREVGGPMTNLLLKVLHNNEDDDYLVNYRAIGPEGKEFRSSTFFIKNGKGKKIGALCVNVDVGKFKLAYEALGEAFGFSMGTLEEEPKDLQESLYKNTEDAVSMLMDEALKKNMLSFSSMTPDEKLAFIRSLSDSGAFIYKGSVTRVAKVLKVSEPTIYRYISKIKKEL